MKRSYLFWLGALCIAIIPFIAIDIPKHVVDWTRDFHDQLLNTIFDEYHLSNAQKIQAAGNILHSNTLLINLIWIKSILSVVLLLVSVGLLIKAKATFGGLFKKALIIVCLLILSVSLKVYSWYSFSGNNRIRLITVSPADTTLESIYTHNFKGKVVYVDFWGTTCGPCLDEFRQFTKPLKAKYAKNADIAWLNICGGHEAVWRQQLKSYDIAGNNLFLDSRAYSKLYREAVQNKNATVLMPHYLIMDKQGRIVETNAANPSSADTVKTQLDKYLALR